MRVGVDTGGTFTDVVAEDGSIAKVLSTPDDPATAVAAGMSRFGDVDALAHGTTVATNALLERRGARVALITNEGFADMIEIARQDRPSLYDPFADRPEPLVPRELRLEVAGRVGPGGEELQPLGDPPPLPDGVDAVAVCLLHADLEPAHERSLGAYLDGAGVDVSLSHEVSPEFREYERTVTTVVNAYVAPVCRAYVRRLEPLAAEVTVMSSAGGLLDLARATARPGHLLLSGPAGGALAAASAATAAGFPDAVSFDMGGTSTDVCLILDGRPAPAAQRTVGGYPVRLPSLDIHTIGAGGGSIARIDPGGALVVGPESAGADPGPACYGRGGTAATVTDANLVLGRIGAGTSFPGLGMLDEQAARRALDAAEVDAAGVVDVVDAAMVEAIRVVTVHRGVDPRDLALVAFGGAGPLHACAMAAALDMRAVIVPPRAGVFSAVGLLGAPLQADVVHSWPCEVDELVAAAKEQVGNGAVVDVGYDCRYAGQSHEVTVPSVEAFHDEHEIRNGYRRDAPVEIVAVRVTARVERAVTLAPTAGRGRANGPCVLAEPDCTVWVPPGWTAGVDGSGAWVITR